MWAVREKVTAYEVSILPEDHIDAGHFTIRVEYRGRGLWAVLRHGFCWGTDGEWDYESSPSNREDEWLATHRFPLERALELAREQAPRMSVNGTTAEQAYDRAMKRRVT